MREKTRQRLLAALRLDDGSEFDRIGRELGLIRGGVVHGDATAWDLADRVWPRHWPR